LVRPPELGAYFVKRFANAPLAPKRAVHERRELLGLGRLQPPVRDGLPERSTRATALLGISEDGNGEVDQGRRGEGHEQAVD
jgi:hypothetical protein